MCATFLHNQIKYNLKYVTSTCYPFSNCEKKCSPVPPLLSFWHPDSSGEYLCLYMRNIYMWENAVMTTMTALTFEESKLYRVRLSEDAASESGVASVGLARRRACCGVSSVLLPVVHPSSPPAELLLVSPSWSRPGTAWMATPGRPDLQTL